MLSDEEKNLHAGETLDDLILGNMRVIQPKAGYRFSLDAVLLAHFPDPPRRSVIELGAGSGVVSILMAFRAPQARFTAIEIQPPMADRARRSIQLNKLDGRIEVINADIREIEKLLPGGKTELVVSNPPFWKKGEGKISANPEEAIARHEINLTLEELIQKGAYLLQQGGKMAIIHRAERLDEALDTFRRFKIPARKLRMIHSFINKEARLVLIEAEKNRPGPIKIMPPLIIYDKIGEYGRELRGIYNK